MKHSNIYKFETNWEIEEAVCNLRLESQDYIGALQAAKYSRSASAANREKKTAQIYFEMQLFDIAANHYFLYLDVCEPSLRHAAYEGLGLCYLNLGQTLLAKYYLNMAILTNDNQSEIEPEFIDYVQEMSQSTTDDFRLVHPPELADYTDLLANGRQMLRKRQYEQAIELLKTVPKQSSYYKDAANDMTIAYLLCEDYPNAEVVANAVLEKYPGDITALSSLQSVYLQTQRKERAAEIAQKLYSTKTDNIEDLFKAASVLCEQNMPHLALEKYKQIEVDAPFDIDILFTLAALNYNIGNLYKAVKYLRDIVDIYNDTTAKYYLNNVNIILFEQKDISALTPMPYIMRLPQEEIKKYLTKISEIAALNKKQAEAFEFTSQIKDMFNWCFISQELGDTALEIIAINALANIYTKSFGYITELLLHSTLSDGVKFELIGKLCEKQINGEVGVVVGGIYKSVHFYMLNVEKAARAVFLKAYSLCFSKFALINQSYGAKVKDATEQIYYGVQDKSLLKAVDYKTLAAAIYLQTNIKEIGRSVKKVAALFEGDAQIVKQILEQVKENI